MKLQDVIVTGNSLDRVVRGLPSMIELLIASAHVCKSHSTAVLYVCEQFE